MPLRQITRQPETPTQPMQGGLRQITGQGQWGAEEEEHGMLGELGAGLGRGVLRVIGTPANLADIAGEAVGWEGLEKAGEAGAEAIEQYIQKSPRLRKSASISGDIRDNPQLWTDPRWYLSLIGEGAPTIASMIIPGMVAAKATKIAGMGTKAIQAARFGGALSAGMGLEAGGAAEDVRQYEERTGEQVPIGKKLKTVVGTGVVAGSLEAVPVFNLFGGTVARKLIGRIITSMAFEGGTEGAQEIVANAFAKAGYDADRDMIGGVIESVIGGVLLGGGMGAMQQTFQERIKETNSDKVADLLAQAEKEQAEKPDIIAMIDEGMTTGEINGELFTPEIATGIIQEAYADKALTDKDLDNFKEKYPKLQHGLNDLIGENVKAKIDEQAKLELASIEKTGIALTDEEITAERAKVFEESRKPAEISAEAFGKEITEEEKTRAKAEIEPDINKFLKRGYKPYHIPIATEVTKGEGIPTTPDQKRLLKGMTVEQAQESAKLWNEIWEVTTKKAEQEARIAEAQTLIRERPDLFNTEMFVPEPEIEERLELPSGQGFELKPTTKLKKPSVLKPYEADVSYKSMVSKSGKPFKSMAKANTALKQRGLSPTEYTIIEHEGGFAIQRFGRKVKPTPTEPTAEIARIEKKQVEFIGMQEQVSKPPIPLVNELDTKSTVAYDSAKHELTNLADYEKAVAAEKVESQIKKAIDYQRQIAQKNATARGINVADIESMEMFIDETRSIIGNDLADKLQKYAAQGLKIDPTSEVINLGGKPSKGILKPLDDISKIITITGVAPKVKHTGFRDIDKPTEAKTYNIIGGKYHGKTMAASEIVERFIKEKIPIPKEISEEYPDLIRPKKTLADLTEKELDDFYEKEVLKPRPSKPPKAKPPEAVTEDFEVEGIVEPKPKAEKEKVEVTPEEKERIILEQEKIAGTRIVPDYVRNGDEYWDSAKRKYPTYSDSAIENELSKFENPDKNIDTFGKTYLDTVKKARAWWTKQLEKEKVEVTPEKKPKYRKVVIRPSKVRTLRSAIRELGGIDFQQFKGELETMDLSIKYLHKKTGRSIDVVEMQLREDGWLYPDEVLLDVLTDKKNLSRDRIGKTALEKPEHELSPEEIRIKKEMQWEPEEPPKGEYTTINAEDLPLGKELTLIEGKSKEGWDVYEVTAKDPFEITLMDGQEITLHPLDKVDVLKEDLAKPKVPKEQVEGFKPEAKLLGGEELIPKIKAAKKTELAALDKIERKATSKFEQDSMFEPNQQGLFGKPAEKTIPPRPLINPKASALKQDEQLRDQQAWDKKYGEKLTGVKEPSGVRDEKAFATTTIKPQATITRADLKKIFAKMKNISTGVDKDGNFFFRPFGKPVVTIYEVREILGYKPLSVTQRPDVKSIITEKSRDAGPISAKKFSDIFRADSFLDHLNDLIQIPLDSAVRGKPSDLVLRKVTSSQRLRKSVSRDIQFLSNILSSKPFREKGFSGLDVKTQRLMLSRMRSMVKNFKVTDSIVKSIPVDMVDDFSWEKFSFEKSLQNPSVFIDILSVLSEGRVFDFGDLTAPIIKVLALDVTKNLAGLTNSELIGVLSDSDATISTSSIYHKIKDATLYDKSQEEFEGYIQTSGGRIPVGSYLRNVIELKTSGVGPTADESTLFHEFCHFLEKNNILSGNDIKALNGVIAKSQGISESKVTEEHRATYVGDRLSEWQGQKNLRIRRVLKKIADFVNSIWEFVSQTRTARGVLADISSGKILSEKELSAVNQFAQDVSFSLKKAAKAITDNPNFVKWFEDSKVVDEDGSPMVVYHGTDRIFTVFDPMPEKAEHPHMQELGAIIFTSDKENAEFYAQEGSVDSARNREAPQVYSCYLQIENPLIIDETKSKEINIENAIDYRIVDIVEEAKDGGHDGIIAYGPNGIKDIMLIAFKPTQIKSMFNTGAFGITEPDIMFATKPTKDYRAMLRKYQVKHTTPLVDELTEAEEKPSFLDTLEPVTSEDYLLNRKASKSIKLTAITNIKRVAAEIAEGVDKFLGSTSTRIGRVSLKLKAKLRKLDFDINTKYAADVKSIHSLLKKAKKMNRDDFADWDYARKNSNIKKINELIDKYDMQAEYAAYRKVLDDTRKEGLDVGLVIGEIEEYAPRILKDDRGFLKEIGKPEYRPLYSDQLKKRAQDMKMSVESLPLDLKADIISNIMLGGWVGLGGIPATKHRVLQKIPANLNKYYMHSDAALMQHLYSMRKGIEARKFFGEIPKKVKEIRKRLYHVQSQIRELSKSLKGKLSETELAKIKKQRNKYISLEKQYMAYIQKYALQRDYTENIGAYIVELIEKKEIDAKHERIVNDMLKARFHEVGTRGVIQMYKNLSYIDTMGSPISALTQIGDMAWAMYEGGLIRSLKYGFKAAIKKSRITKEDVGVERIAQEFADSGTLGDVVSKVFKIVGLEKIDSIGKEALLNTALEKYQKRAKKEPLKFKKELKPIFGIETNSVIEDLVNDEISENVKLLVYSRLLDFQPVALSEMPQRYLDAGNGRLFYMLKTFTLKVFDVFRNESYNKIRYGNKADKIQGMKNFVRLSLFFVLANAGADELKDWVLGRKTDFEDRIVDNVLRLCGVSKFVTWKARTEGVGSALARQILPPFKFIDSAGKDIITAGDEKGLEVIGSIPVVGKLAYWHIGRGTSKREDLWNRRLRKQKSKLNKIKDGLEKTKNKMDYRRKHGLELRKLRQVNELQGELNDYRKRINRLKSMKETPARKKRIQTLEVRRTELIKNFLSKK